MDMFSPVTQASMVLRAPSRSCGSVPLGPTERLGGLSFFHLHCGLLPTLRVFDVDATKPKAWMCVLPWCNGRIYPPLKK